MTHHQIRHEQFFPVHPLENPADVLTKAENFLKASAAEHPDWEYVVHFQKDGLLVTGSIIE